jgi:hypothetical protein
VASALLLGNPMTACSLYTCMAVSACAWSLLTVFEHPSSSRWRRWLRFIVLLVGPLASAVLLRFVLQRGLDIHDDDHLPNLLRAKWGTLADFHTSMYLRIEGYRALPLAVYWELTKTGLLPLAAGAALALSLQIAWDLVSAVDPHRPPPPPPPAAVLHLGLALQLTALAALFSRLRGLWTPALCIMAGMGLSAVPWGSLATRARAHRPWLWRTASLAIMCLMVTFGTDNLRFLRERYYAEQYSDMASLAALVQWIQTNTAPDAIIATDMILSAPIRLSAGRRTLVHPHYEDRAFRHKYYMAAHWMGHRRLKDVHRILSDMGAEYMVDNSLVCDSNAGKTYAVMVDEGEDGNPPPPMPRAAVPACRAARTPNPFFVFLYQPPGKSFGFGDFRLYRLTNRTAASR